MLLADEFPSWTIFPFSLIKVLVLSTYIHTLFTEVQTVPSFPVLQFSVFIGYFYSYLYTEMGATPEQIWNLNLRNNFPLNSDSKFCFLQNSQSENPHSESFSPVFGSFFWILESSFQ